MFLAFKFLCKWLKTLWNLKLISYLQHLRCLISLLSWVFSYGLAAPSDLRSELVRNLLQYILNDGPAVDSGAGVKQAIVRVLHDNFSDSVLRQILEVNLIVVVLRYLLREDADCQHLHLDLTVF